MKGGHLTASKEEQASAEEIARVRKKVWIAAGVIAFLAMIVWCACSAISCSFLLPMLLPDGLLLRCKCYSRWQTLGMPLFFANVGERHAY